MKYKSIFSTLTLSMFALAVSPVTMAQDEQDDASEDLVLEEVIVTGSARQALASALNTKRDSDNLVEAIYAEDIGKLPDQNLAEVLENITGVQITRRAGVGTGVQIRGTNANRVEINGVSTVGSGAGRSGINFEDVNSAIIAGVEVIKSPEAKTIEGSVGGTINLKTIRPLSLPDTLGHVRVQAEDSSLSTESWQPRISGAYGDRWETGAGDFGFVISGSYTEQYAVSFRPRTDRDNISSPPGANPSEFLGIQFLVQEQEEDIYETGNLATTFEWAPTDNMKFNVDYMMSDQTRNQNSYRLQASGVSAFRNRSYPTAFENVDFGVGPGVFPAALAGSIEPDLDFDDDDPNLRFSSDTGSRETESNLFAIGGEWENDKWLASFEYASTSSETWNPNVSPTLNFINPNCPLDGSSNDNCVPFEYDLSGKSLAWGVNYNSPFAPSPDSLLDPANVVLDQVIVGNNSTDNSEDALRFDFTYFLDIGGFQTIDFGFRGSESQSEFNAREDRIGGFSKMVDSPNGSSFAELLVPGPDNYGRADGRDMFIRNFLLFDADRIFNNPDEVVRILQAATLAHNPDKPGNVVLDLSSKQDSYYDIREDTSAFYLQTSFAWGKVRGNLGVRYLDTDIDSIGYGPEDAIGNRDLQSTKGSYDFWLPRLNLVWDATDNLVARFGYSTDIRRPNFNQLATGFDYDNQENSVIALGNPGLEPEEVDSLDLSVEWYFAEAAVLSAGYFRKERTNIFGERYEGAVLLSDPSVPGGLARETDPSCPGGGIYNPIVVPNILGDPEQLGMCVDFTIPGNDPETTTVSGWEFAFQYDFSNWEDKWGWASGFGVVANATFQDFSGGSDEDCTSGRGEQVLGDVCIDRGLLDFSETAYNFTLYYEKYNFSARMRYTWREGFRTQDFGGGANTSGSSTFSFPVHTLDRGQLNASIFYNLKDHWMFGVEAVNLTKEAIYQHCVSEKGPLCFVGYPDRRVVLSAAYRF
jgi:iron complex outermembrane receptor protein